MGLSGVQPQLGQLRFLNLGFPHWVQNWDSLSAPQEHCHTLVWLRSFSTLGAGAAGASGLVSGTLMWLITGAAASVCFAFLRRISRIMVAIAAVISRAMMIQSIRPLVLRSFWIVLESGLGAREVEGAAVGAVLALGEVVTIGEGLGVAVGFTSLYVTAAGFE